MNERYFLAGALICSLLCSCFKEEPLNAECDITQVSFHIDNPSATFFSVSDTLQTVSSSDSVVTFAVRRNPEADLSTLIPHLAVSPGATIALRERMMDSEAGGYFRYRITSEDRLWHRDYKVSVTPVLRMVNDTVAYDFEFFELEPREQKYYIWSDRLPDGTLTTLWASGNPGFRLSMGTAPATDYPSAPLAEGYEGYGLQLTTRSTGPFGALAGKRIAAGNFFLGTFDVTNALKAPLHATHFGVPFDREPVTLSGHYKYQPGDVFQDSHGQPVAGRTDRAAVYAVLYRNHDAQGNQVSLHGDDVKTSPLIVAIADMGTVVPTTQWTEFTVPFHYTGTLDYDLLHNRGYSLAIVFSSSDEGDKFEGAIGSQLCIDRVRVVCKKEQ